MLGRLHKDRDVLLIALSLSLSLSLSLLNLKLISAGIPLLPDLTFARKPNPRLYGLQWKIAWLQTAESEGGSNALR